MAKLVKLQDGMRDGGGSDDGSLVAESIAVIEALSDPTAGDAVYLNAGGRSGWFNFDASDLSSEVSSDTQQGIYIAPDADATGASGAWVRQYEGRAFLEWGGFSVDRTGAENAIIMRAMLDISPCTCGPGDFPLDQMQLKTGDDFHGSGYETNFTSSSAEPNIFLGSISAGSFTPGGPDVSDFYGLDAVSVGDTSITLSDPTDGARFTEGGTAVIWSTDEGYTDGLGTFKPAFQQIVGIVSVSSGVIQLEEPAYRTGIGNMAATPGEEVTGSLGTFGISRGVNVGNFSLTNTTSSAMRYGGTYKSDVGPVWFRETNSAFIMNGFAHSKFTCPNAKFRLRAVDCAYFSHNSNILFEQWTDEEGADNAETPLFSFNEGSRQNTLKTGTGFANSTNGVSGRRDALIKFADSSGNIAVVDGLIGAKQVKSLVEATRRAGSPMDYSGNMLYLNGCLRGNDANNVISHSAIAAGERYDLSIIGGGRLKVDALQVNYINLTASGLRVDAEIDAAARPITTLGNVVTDVDLTGLRAKNAPSLLNIADGSQVNLKGAKFGVDAQIAYLDDLEGAGASISSTSFSAIYDKTIEAGTIAPGDLLLLEMAGNITGTASSKRIQVRFNGNNEATLTIPAGTTGAYFVTGHIKFLTASAQRIYLSGNLSNALAPSRGTAAIDTDTVPLQLEVGAFVDNGSDAISVESLTVTTKRATGA